MMDLVALSEIATHVGKQLIEHGAEATALLCIAWIIRTLRTLRTIPDEFNQQRIVVLELVEAVESLKRSLEDSVEGLKARMRTTDRIISDIADLPYDSETISKDGTRFPRVRKHHEPEN